MKNVDYDALLNSILPTVEESARKVLLESQGQGLRCLSGQVMSVSSTGGIAWVALDQDVGSSDSGIIPVQSTASFAVPGARVMVLFLPPSSTILLPYATETGRLVASGSATGSNSSNSTTAANILSLAVTYNHLPGMNYEFELSTGVIYCSTYTATYFTYLGVFVTHTGGSFLLDTRAISHHAVNVGGTGQIRRILPNASIVPGPVTLVPRWRIQGTNTSTIVSDWPLQLNVYAVGPDP